MKHLHTLLCMTLWLLATVPLSAQSSRERLSLDDGWQFAFGSASSPAEDFGCGTEYFNYLTKVASIHNEGPYSPKFKPEKWGRVWKPVNLPHDWVVDLPYDTLASHSHGYKQVGHRYPDTSVGWYRKTFSVGEEDRGKHLWLQFDGIFRDARVWLNGFYLGHEPSGYATQLYDISEYLNYGGDNLLCVRVDATLEEGWFYEGAGIYRHVWLCKSAPLHVKPFGVAVNAVVHPPYSKAAVNVVVSLQNSGLALADSCEVLFRLIDEDNRILGDGLVEKVVALLPQGEHHAMSQIELKNPHLWSPDAPYIYKVETSVWQNGEVVDKVVTPFGVRDIQFSATQGLVLNGKPLKLKGVNMHQDHAGVGAALPDDLHYYRLRRLKAMGCNAYRASHNPMTPELLDACDRLGLLVIEENRLPGINEEHLRLLWRMMDRDRNHPSVMLWSMGNEEWGIEWDEKSERIVATLREYCHRYDPTRLMTVATSGGPNIVTQADVAGYNYILQNPVDEHRRNYPMRLALGSEETTGCGTRGVYYNRADLPGIDTDTLLQRLAPVGTMKAINRAPAGRDSLVNCISRGWKFYDERQWLAGLFYWTGFDYRGEPNPLKFPSTGSEFGIFDYCGFPKDEAYYLKSWWTDEPVLHLLPHWNLHGLEDKPVEVWAYSNCDAVELFVNGRSMGRKSMPRGGHLSWTVPYRPGTLRAVGYKGKRRVAIDQRVTAGEEKRIKIEAERAADGVKAPLLNPDAGRQTVVANLSLEDARGFFQPTACRKLTLRLDGDARFLGVGNGNPAWQAAECPADAGARSFEVETFNGRAQVLLEVEGAAKLHISGNGLDEAVLQIE